MKRLLLLVVCLAVAAAAACSKKPAESAATPAAQPQAAAPAAGGPSEDAPDAEPKKVEFTDALVLKYMEYQKALVVLSQEYSTKATNNMKAADGGTLKALNSLAATDKALKEFEEKLAAKRRELGFDEEEFKIVQDAVGTMATGRALYNQMGGDAQVARIEAEAKAEMAKMTPEQKTAAEAQLADATRSFADMKNGLDVRKKYGDQAADVLLRHADELAKQYWEGLKAMGEKK